MRDDLATGADHLVRCCQRALRGEFTQSDAELMMNKLGCSSFVGGGTFGAVFASEPRHVVKICAHRPGSRVLPAGARHEFQMQRAFALQGLADAPLWLRRFQLRAPDIEDGVELSAMCMQRLRTTLDRHLAEAPERVGPALAQLLRRAAAAGLVHNDAKCNNIGVAASGELLFIDFGRSFDACALRDLGHSPEAVPQLVALGSALDAWRLQASLGRCFQKCGVPDKIEEEIRPLRELGRGLLNRAGVDPPSDLWERRAFEELQQRFKIALLPRSSSGSSHA